jgi:hypothetical protein
MGKITATWNLLFWVEFHVDFVMSYFIHISWHSYWSRNNFEIQCNSNEPMSSATVVILVYFVGQLLMEKL